MSTRGYINATLQILGGTAIPLHVSLPDASISIVIDVNGQHFLLPSLVGFLLKQPDFQFPVFIEPFNNTPLIDFTLSFMMQQPAFKVSGTLPDIRITPDRVLSAPTLNADLYPNTCCICISGMVTGGAGSPQATHFGYHDHWRPQDGNGNDLSEHLALRFAPVICEQYRTMVAPR